MGDKTRGITSDIGSFDKDQIVKPRGQRIKEWLAIPRNAATFMLILAGMCYLAARIGGGIYILPIAWLMKKYFLSLPEKAPVKIPIQEATLDLHQLSPGDDRKPIMGKGMFFIGKETVGGKEIWLTDDDTKQHFLILGTTGAGKAVRKDALVHTPIGWRRAGDIQEGDVITSPENSKPVRVSGVFDQGKRKLWNVQFADGQAARVDGEHLWEVFRIVDGNTPKRILTTKAIQKQLTATGEKLYIRRTDAVDNMATTLPMTSANLVQMVSNEQIARIPEAFMKGSLSQRKTFIRDLLTQFAPNENGVTYVPAGTWHPELLSDIQKLVWSLGGRIKVLHSFGESILEVKFNNPALIFGYGKKCELLSEIVSVEETEDEEECVCFRLDSDEHLFIIDDYVVTHNTELLMAFAANALSWGSGLIFVDGKGDIKLMGAMYALVQRWGRDADFLLLNFMPVNMDKMIQGEISSNSMNPYVTADADDIKQQIVGLMPESGGDGMWKDRAMTMLEAEIMCLVWCRDNGILDMSLDALRQYILLDNIAKFTDPEAFPGMPETLRENVKLYLSSLGNYNYSKPGGQQEADVAKQHSYLEMQLSGPFAALKNQYGAIFDTDFGDVDMFDVVLNRRILVCLLPALQKSEDDIARMGKIVVASLKSMMGGTLGNLGMTADPTVLSLLKVRVTTAPSPFIVILDEVGYYTVSGMAIIAAQVRSLGFSMVYSAQDIKAMTRNNDKEAYSIIANTNTKIIMRSEDSDTIDIAVKAGGQSSRVKATGYKPSDNTPTFGGGEWNQNMEFAISLENRINELDLKAQEEGFFTLINKDMIVRGRSFYVATLESFDDEDSIPLAPNQFLTVRKPNIQVFESNKRIPKIIETMTSPDFRKKQEEIIEKLKGEKNSIETMANIFEAISVSKNAKNKTLKDISCLALGGISVLTKGEEQARGDIVRNARRAMPQGTPVGIDSEFEPEDNGISLDVVSAPPISNKSTPTPNPSTNTLKENTDFDEVTNKSAPEDAISVDNKAIDNLIENDRRTPLHGIEVNEDGIHGNEALDSDSTETAISAIGKTLRFSEDIESMDDVAKDSVKNYANEELDIALGDTGEEINQANLAMAYGNIGNIAQHVDLEDEETRLEMEEAARNSEWADGASIQDYGAIENGYPDFEEPDDTDGTETETETTTTKTETEDAQKKPTEKDIAVLTGDKNVDDLVLSASSNEILDINAFLSDIKKK